MSAMLSFEIQQGTTDGKPGCTSAMVGVCKLVLPVVLVAFFFFSARRRSNEEA